MEGTLIRINRHWENKKYASLHNRALLDQLLKKKDLPHIQVLTGVRRSGKSTIFKLLINHLMEEGTDPKEILLLHLDEPAFTTLWDNVSELNKVVELTEKLTSKHVNYLFLDEVQQVNDWELFVKGSYDTNRFKKIYVTGSNSNLLQNKFATLLSGRYFANTVRPFSIKEVFMLHQFSDRLTAVSRKPEMLRMIDEYLVWGSFPEIVLSKMNNDIKTDLLHSYYESIVLKDCITFNQLRDAQLFYRFLHFLLTNIGSCFRFSSIGKALKSNENTVRSYLASASQSFVVSDITNFSFSLKEDSRPLHKVFCIDNGLMNVVSSRFSPYKGALLENAVYNELVNNGYEMITFARKNEECDFIAQKDKQYHAFQVCHELTPGNQDRELAGFKAISDDVHLASKTIVTYDQENKLEDVYVIPFWQLFGGL